MNPHTSGHRRGVVAAPHHAAAEAGRHVLADGGNALEAMVAMAASIAAVYPHMNHIGGDGFWMVREPSGRVRALMAPGPAGAKATIGFYKERGYDAIPSRGPLAALTVPGAIGGWMLALQAAKSLGGKLPLDVLLEPAVKQARDGYVVSRSQHELTRDKLPEMGEATGFAQTFLIDGKVPAQGAIMKQPALAATLDHLAKAGLEDFYCGDVGREIAADLERIGSPVTRPDLEKFRAYVADPLSVKLDVGTLYNAPPPTQGLASLIILALFERLRVAEADGFDFVHGLVESTKRAFRLRDRVVTDPNRIQGSLERHLSPAVLDSEARQIARKKAAPWPAPQDKGDTVWMGAADASGLVVSYIQSIYWEFGSGCVLPRTGVLMQNRGASFSLDKNAVNPLEPGRLPFHTLNPALAVLKDGRVMAYGTMGGDGQPQTQGMVFSRYVLFRKSLPEAVDAPRWLLGRTWGSAHSNLRMESRFDGNLVEALLSAGHDVQVMEEGHSDTMGHAGAVVLHPDGTMEAAHDPRADPGAYGV
jgi:gamma-glutamyltranspeptidase/glutathione hydrolase